MGGQTSAVVHDSDLTIVCDVVTYATDSTGLKQATGPGNRTQDLQNDRAVKSGIRTLDLQRHGAHEEHETYTDRAREIQIAHATSTWNMDVVRRTTDRPFEDDTSIQKICSIGKHIFFTTSCTKLAQTSTYPVG